MAENENTAPRRKTLDELMQFAQERAARGREAAEQNEAETPRQLFQQASTLAPSVLSTKVRPRMRLRRDPRRL
ncbi:hypothetical protein [Xylella fastidiosa]|uniref:hypothetical protein n=1 Tax=Xylella fastidiosa TaxID=2371 RepID=UPI0012D91E00|nr:hypothetical protein [Xylella fastidiosa]